MEPWLRTEPTPTKNHILCRFVTTPRTRPVVPHFVREIHYGSTWTQRRDRHTNIYIFPYPVCVPSSGWNDVCLTVSALCMFVAGMLADTGLSIHGHNGLYVGDT